MYVHAIAFSLPDQKTYHAAHAHVDPAKCVWKPQDREVYYRLLDLITQLYKDRDLRDEMKPSELSAYYQPEVPLDRALQMVVPYHVTADRVTKNTTLLEEDRDTVSRVKEAGIGEPHGLDFYLLVRGTSGLSPTRELISRVFRSLARKHKVRARNDKGELLPLESWDEGMDVLIDGEVVDLDSKEFRRYPMLVSVARARPHDSLVTSGKLLIVAVPNEVPVDLVSNRGGEVIRERARTWPKPTS